MNRRLFETLVLKPKCLVEWKNIERTESTSEKPAAEETEYESPWADTVDTTDKTCKVYISFGRYDEGEAYWVNSVSYSEANAHKQFKEDIVDTLKGFPDDTTMLYLCAYELQQSVIDDIIKIKDSEDSGYEEADFLDSILWKDSSRRLLDEENGADAINCVVDFYTIQEGQDPEDSDIWDDSWDIVTNMDDASLTGLIRKWVNEAR